MYVQSIDQAHFILNISYTSDTILNDGHNPPDSDYDASTFDNIPAGEEMMDLDLREELDDMEEETIPQ